MRLIVTWSFNRGMELLPVLAIVRPVFGLTSCVAEANRTTLGCSDDRTTRTRLSPRPKYIDM